MLAGGLLGGGIPETTANGTPVLLTQRLALEPEV
jgi:hypothetical protein